MSLSFPYVRSAYQRMISAAGPVPFSLLVSLIAMTGIAWAVTLYQVVGTSAPVGAGMQNDMAAMDMGGMVIGGMPGWSLAGLTIFVMVWTVMMAAMMLPAAMPMILIFASAQARRDRRVTSRPGFSSQATSSSGEFRGCLSIALLKATSASWVTASCGPRSCSRQLSSFSGVYQFTLLKRICLRHCRSPFGFVAQHWREGRVGALQMGLHHGLYCLGCCWALFTVLVAAGMMSIAWMLLLTIVIFAEKVLPHGTRTSAVVGVGLIALGLLMGAGLLQPPGF